MYISLTTPASPISKIASHVFPGLSGMNHMQIDKAEDVSEMFGNWKDRPLTKSLDHQLPAVSEKLAAELPCHAPGVEVGGVAEAFNAPSGVGALSAVRFAASKV
jgi:hypothetical protein